jgi:hypothetical protein
MWHLDHVAATQHLVIQHAHFLILRHAYDPVPLKKRRG